MEYAKNMYEGMRYVSNRDLIIMGGQDYIRDACALIGVISVASGGAIVLNPIGGTVVGFCVGYSLGVTIAGWF